MMVTASLIILGIIVAIAGTAAYTVARRIKYESQLADMWWKINWGDLVFAERAAGKRSTLSLGISENSFRRTAASSISALSMASSMNTTLKNVHGVMVAMHKVS